MMLAVQLFDIITELGDTHRHLFVVGLGLVSLLYLGHLLLHFVLHLL